MLKLTARLIDQILFNGVIRRTYGRHLATKQDAAALNSVESCLDYSFVTHYTHRQPNLVTSLCDKYGSDKGTQTTGDYNFDWYPHTYSDYYHCMFAHCRHFIRRVFECGLGTTNPAYANNMGPSGRPGASLRVWREYFPNAHVFGADIDKASLFEEDRIKTFYVDQTNPASVKDMWEQIGEHDFDVIIDDGMHAFAAGSCLFMHSISYLRPGGLYVIEDVATRDWPKYIEFFKSTQFFPDFVRLMTPSGKERDNSLIVIRT